MKAADAFDQCCLARAARAWAARCGHVGSCSWAYTTPVSSIFRCLHDGSLLWASSLIFKSRRRGACDDTEYGMSLSIIQDI